MMTPLASRAFLVVLALGVGSGLALMSLRHGWQTYHRGDPNPFWASPPPPSLPSG